MRVLWMLALVAAALVHASCDDDPEGEGVKGIEFDASEYNATVDVPFIVEVTFADVGSLVFGEHSVRFSTDDDTVLQDPSFADIDLDSDEVDVDNIDESAFRPKRITLTCFKAGESALLRAELQTNDLNEIVSANGQLSTGERWRSRWRGRERRRRHRWHRRRRRRHRRPRDGGRSWRDRRQRRLDGDLFRARRGSYLLRSDCQHRRRVAGRDAVAGSAGAGLRAKHEDGRCRR